MRLPITCRVGLLYVIDTKIIIKQFVKISQRFVSHMYKNTFHDS